MLSFNIKKILVCGIIISFFGLAITPSLSGNVKDTINIVQTDDINNFVRQRESLSDPPEEEWNTTFGGEHDDMGYSVQQTTDGGYIIVGLTGSYGNGGHLSSDVWLIKTDGNGEEQWNRTFGGNRNDEGFSVQQTIDGGYIITGFTDSYGVHYGDLWLIKTDADGYEEWNKTYHKENNEVGYCIQQTSDGGYIIVGYEQGRYNDDHDVWLVKTDVNGNDEWNRTFGRTGFNLHDRGYSVQQTIEGGYIIAGLTISYGPGGVNLWLIKTDEYGHEDWNTTFGGQHDDRGYSVQQTNDEGYIITGGKGVYWGGEHDVWLIKTDVDGYEEWNTTFGGEHDDMGYSVQQTTDDGYIIVGGTQTYPFNDFLLIKTDEYGHEDWNTTFGGTYEDVGYSVQQTMDSGYILTGYTKSYGSGSYDVWLIKVSPENGGNQPPVADANGPYSGCVGEEILFDASNSYDLDGSIVGYRWDWETDGEWDTGWLSDPQISYVHDKEIHGKLKLEVKDDQGGTDNDAAFIHIAEPFYFVHITDTHIGSNRFGILIGSYALKNFKRCIEYLDSFERKPEFLVISGDIVQLGARKLISVIWYLQFNKVLDDHKMIHYCCPGNHDYYTRLGKSGNLDNYHKYIDAEYNSDNFRYNFTHSNTHFISINSGYDDGETSIPRQGSGLTPEDIDYLKKDLDGLDEKFDGKDSSGLNKIIFMHHPIINYGGKIVKHWNHAVITKNREEFIEVCDKYKVDLVLTGHTHRNIIYKRTDDGTNKDGWSAPRVCTKTLYVQTAACEDKWFRNVTIRGDEVTVEIPETAP